MKKLSMEEKTFVKVKTNEFISKLFQIEKVTIALGKEKRRFNLYKDIFVHTTADADICFKDFTVSALRKYKLLNVVQT